MAVESGAAVIGAEIEVVARGTYLVRVDEKVFVAGSYDHIHGDSTVMEPFGLRIDRSGADSAGNEYVSAGFEFLFALMDEGRRVPERADDIVEKLTFLLGDDCG